MSLAFAHHDAVEAAGPASQGSPRLLLVATMCWMFPARLALALRQAGFHVEAICQRGHPIRLLKNPIPTHKLGWLSASTSIKTAINNAAPHRVQRRAKLAVSRSTEVTCTTVPAGTQSRRRLRGRISGSLFRLSSPLPNRTRFRRSRCNGE